MQGKLKTNWSDHFGVLENVLDTDSVMSLQKIRGSRSRRRSVGLCALCYAYGIKHGHLNLVLGTIPVGVFFWGTHKIKDELSHFVG